MSGTTERKWAHWTEPSWVEVDGLATAYRRKGAGEPLLFLHGAGLTRQWLPLYDALARTFDVIVPEHPGFGDTELPDWLETFDDLVLHYDALLRTLGIERPHVVGHSLGGWTAAELAVFYPERFASLTLISAMGLRVPEAPAADPFRWSEAKAGEMLLNGVGEQYAEFLQQDEEPLEQMLHEYGEGITFARLTWNPRYDVRLDRRLGRLQTPTLVLHPADDNYIPVAHSERYAELIPGARLEVLDGQDGEPASHVITIQQPERIAALVAAHTAALA
ncbi:MAG TPA: alpha/beta hydrolase [Solirubrobacteraceae bacterium]|nr:alpha/beta hydrolase [Solirubrobacteraceae bacterium]